jgi:hypothetical protein
MLKVLSSEGLSRCYGELRHYVLERVKIEPALVYEVWASSDYDVHARSIEGTTTIEDGHLLFFANGAMVSYDEFCVWYYSKTKSELEQVLDALDGVLKRIDELELSIKGDVKAPATKRTLSSETIVSLYNEGVSVKEIAIKAGVKPASIYTVIRRYGDK